MYTHIRIHIHVWMCVYMHACICIWTRTYTWMYIMLSYFLRPARTRLPACICVYFCICICTWMYTHMHRVCIFFLWSYCLAWCEHLFKETRAFVCSCTHRFRFVCTQCHTGMHTCMRRNSRLYLRVLIKHHLRRARSQQACKAPRMYLYTCIQIRRRVCLWKYLNMYVSRAQYTRAPH